MISHPVFSLLTAALIATGIALTENRSVRERVNHAIYMFLCCTLAVVGGGWLMFLIHG
jgi:hypothetical protein